MKSEYQLSPAQIKKLNRWLGKKFELDVPLILRIDEEENRAFVFVPPFEEEEIPIKVAFKL